MDFKTYRDSHKDETRAQSDTSQDDIRKTAEKYGKKSDEELLNDILSLANQERSKGALSDESLNAFARKLSPMLNEEQRQRLDQVLNLLKKD